MKVLLISDAHSNLQALGEVLNRTAYDEILFMGDVVDYGPNPLEALDVLEHEKAKRVLGNHDAAAAFGTDCRSSKTFHEAAMVTRNRITLKVMPEDSLDLLGKAKKTLNLDYNGLKVRSLHAAPDDELYHYISKEDASKLKMDGSDLILLGHTHNPYEIKKNGIWVVNPGSVGMPKDGDPRASFAVLDTARRHVEFGRVGYDVELMLSELRSLIGDDKQIFELLAKSFSTGS